MPTTLRLILGDQLTPTISSLSDLNPAEDVVLLAEVLGECSYVPHHKQKIALVLAAMRHFAAALASRKLRVDYVKLDDPANTHTLRGELARAVARHGADRVVVTEAGEHRLAVDMQGWTGALGCKVEIRPDTRFIASRADFAAWAHGKRSLRMEFFYRDMRRRTGLLMEGDAPEGGRWNFDAENRKPLPKTIKLPTPKRFPPDAMTSDVLALVAARFSDHPGALDNFAWPVTAAQARQALADFIAHRLPSFGDWQDAMRTGAPYLFHAVISAALNLGLLNPLEICQAAEAAYRDGRVPLNAAEGFIRQIIGWREFIRGIYWLHMPRYGTLNALGATRALPAFYWSGQTRMNCMRQAISETMANAYAHHIQRLMITGNFALLAGLHPDAVDEWYLAVYADAYEWVEMPNTRGMALFADGGIVGSKPYAASGAYINRMSDYCGACSYKVKDATGPDACPFNYLYWDFFARHGTHLGTNPRIAMPLQTLAKMEPGKVASMRAKAKLFLTNLEQGKEV